MTGYPDSRHRAGPIRHQLNRLVDELEPDDVHDGPDTAIDGHGDDLDGYDGYDDELGPPPARLPRWMLPAAVALLAAAAAVTYVALAGRTTGDGAGGQTAAVGSTNGATPGSTAATVPTGQEITAVVAPAGNGATVPVPPAVTAGSGGSASSAPAAAAGSSGPSQAEGRAAADGVLPVVAALPLGERMAVQAEAAGADGRRWVLSRLPQATVTRLGATTNGRLGDPAGPAAQDYGEVLLLGPDGTIERAWPMPGAPPNWLVATPARAWAGHDGDGTLPDSTLARIEPGGGATVVVVPSETGATGATWPAGWHLVSGDDIYDYRGLIGFGSGGMTGTKAVSPLGDVVVSLDSIDGLINRTAGIS